MIKLNLESLLKEIQEELNKTNTDEIEATKNIIIKMLETIEDDVDFDKEAILNDAIKNLQSASTKEKVTENINIDKILNNTLQHFEYDFSKDTKDILKDIALIDNTIIYQEKKIFHKIYYFLIFVDLHKKALIELENLEDETLQKRGIAKTKHPTADEAVKPKINHFTETLEHNNIPANVLGLNIYKDFNKTPLDLITALQTFDISTIKNIEQSQIKTFNNQKVFLNSNEKIEDYHIFKSIKLYAIILFKNNKYTNKKLAKDINIIVDNLFSDDIFESKLNRTHITKEIQQKVFFNHIFILENQTPSNIKENPIFN